MTGLPIQESIHDANSGSVRTDDRLNPYGHHELPSESHDAMNSNSQQRDIHSAVQPTEDPPAALNSPLQRVNTHSSYSDFDRRSALLAEIDEAPFSWLHAKVCLIAGIGFFTDAYDIFAIDIASIMLGYLYGNDRTSGPLRRLDRNQDIGLKVATSAGTLFGQLFFGWLADKVGRKRIYGLELIIMIIATFGQAVSGQGCGVSLIGVLIAWRFLLGVGIGGDYPLSAVISSEFASLRLRGRMMTAVFASQGWGYLTCTLVATIVNNAYADSLAHDVNKLDHMWRIVFGLGCVPAVLALYFRLTIPESPRFTMDIEHNVEKAAKDISEMLNNTPNPIRPFSSTDAVEMLTLDTTRASTSTPPQSELMPRASLKDFYDYFGKLENFKVLFGTAYSWFALDMAFYGLGLNNTIVLEGSNLFKTSHDSTANITIAGTMIVSFCSANDITVNATESAIIGRAVHEVLQSNCNANLILAAAGLIPGYYMSFALIDVWGRKPIQFLGFGALTVLLLIMGTTYDALATPQNSAKNGAFGFFYGLANFFTNFGPNTTTFIVPGELFPTRYRSTAHGISAASGKLGAIIAQVVFGGLKDKGGPNKFVKHILKIFAGFMFTGVLSTYLIPEPMKLTLEQLEEPGQVIRNQRFGIGN